ncbi:hypothetical protein TNCV_2595211 [Trichonephila clavipes]|nr:hypothetical protein TNCV_2595211 [Trichonephila clavipes]
MQKSEVRVRVAENENKNISPGVNEKKGNILRHRIPCSLSAGIKVNHSCPRDGYSAHRVKRSFCPRVLSSFSVKCYLGTVRSIMLKDADEVLVPVLLITGYPEREAVQDGPIEPLYHAIRQMM